MRIDKRSELRCHIAGVHVERVAADFNDAFTEIGTVHDVKTSVCVIDAGKKFVLMIQLEKLLVNVYLKRRSPTIGLWNCESNLPSVQSKLKMNFDKISTESSACRFYHWIRPFSLSATQSNCLSGTKVNACGTAKALGGSAVCML